jgi:hypothetical protein
MLIFNKRKNRFELGGEIVPVCMTHDLMGIIYGMDNPTLAAVLAAYDEDAAEYDAEYEAALKDALSDTI